MIHIIRAVLYPFEAPGGWGLGGGIMEPPRLGQNAILLKQSNRGGALIEGHWARAQSVQWERGACLLLQLSCMLSKSPRLNKKLTNLFQLKIILNECNYYLLYTYVYVHMRDKMYNQYNNNIL